MGSEAEATEGTPTLQLFSSLPSITLKSSPLTVETQNSSKFLLTPPHHALASIPFKWEEKPGKPRPCKTLALPSTTATKNNDDFKCLELPPRLLNEVKFTKTPSPTTVLEGPYIIGKSILHSFRLIRSGRHEGYYDGESNCSPERGLLGTSMASVSKKGKGGGLLGSWRKKDGFGLGSKSQKDFDLGSFVSEDFDGPVDGGGDSGGGNDTTRANVTRISRKRSVWGVSQARPHFWAAIYGALKQVIPRRCSTKWKN